MKRPALQSKPVGVLEMAFQTQKGFRNFRETGPPSVSKVCDHYSAYEVKSKWSLFGRLLEQKKNGVFVFEI